jgi:hypothetical protein
MSFKTASAILRGKLAYRQAVGEALTCPLVISVIKGDAKAAVLLGIEADDSDGGQNGEDQSQNIGKNVYSVYPSTDLRQLPDGSIAYHRYRWAYAQARRLVQLRIRGLFRIDVWPHASSQCCRRDHRY